MKIKQIIVDVLPEDGCSGCCFSKSIISKYGNDKIICTVNNRSVSYFAFAYSEQTHPTWCPLEVKEECVWSGNHGGEDENGDAIFITKKTSCSDVHIQTVNIPDYKYCPNCGKRIRYEGGTC